MSLSWATPTTGTLKVRKYGSATETFSFAGVNTQRNLPPEYYLAGASAFLDIAGLSCQQTGMQRTITQEVSEE